jgi:hypothetical protein
MALNLLTGGRLMFVAWREWISSRFRSKESRASASSMMPNKRLERTVTHKVRATPRSGAARRWLGRLFLLRPAAQPGR